MYCILDIYVYIYTYCGHMCTKSVHIIATSLAHATDEPMNATEGPILDPASLHKRAGSKFLFAPNLVQKCARQAPTSLPGTKRFEPLVSHILVDELFRADYDCCLVPENQHIGSARLCFPTRIRIRGHSQHWWIFQKKKKKV